MAARKRLTRRHFLAGLVLVPGTLTLWASEAGATHYKALLCGDCGFGSKKDYCV